MVPESRIAGAAKEGGVRGVVLVLVPVVGEVREREVQATVMEVMLPDWESGWMGRAMRGGWNLAAS